jgi:YD repeat-containing protein
VAREAPTGKRVLGTRGGGRSTARLLAAVALTVALTAANAGAQSQYVADSTTCAVALTVRHANLDCSFSAGTVHVALPGGAWRAGTPTDGAEYTYDGRGAVVAIAPAPGGVTRYTYDAAGRIAAAHTDAGVATDFVYGETEALERIDGARNTTDFEYDEHDRVVEVRSPETGDTTEYGYDELGRLVTVSALGRTASFTYGPDGLVRADLNGETTEYTYDERHALTAVDGPTGKVTFTYDTRGNVRTARSDERSTTEYSYDRPGRIVSRATASGVTTFTYDARGNLLSGEGGVTYSYGNDGSLRSAMEGEADIAFAYDATAHVVAIAPEDGGAMRTDYDELGRLVLVDVPVGDETVVDFYEGLPNEPYLLEIHWDHGDGTFVWTRSSGHMVACSACP